ncbi:unnamed protein product, partial [Prorocentrum cordatum]
PPRQPETRVFGLGWGGLVGDQQDFDSQGQASLLSVKVAYGAKACGSLKHPCALCRKSKGISQQALDDALGEGALEGRDLKALHCRLAHVFCELDTLHSLGEECAQKEAYIVALLNARGHAGGSAAQASRAERAAMKPQEAAAWLTVRVGVVVLAGPAVPFGRPPGFLGPVGVCPAARPCWRSLSSSNDVSSPVCT